MFVDITMLVFGTRVVSLPSLLGIVHDILVFLSYNVVV